jgi:hypothetical protein
MGTALAPQSHMLRSLLETWVLDPTATRALTAGTPVFIVGRDDFDAAPPWRSLGWLSTTVERPRASPADIDVPGRP